jgi:hypothetical protein
MMTSHPNKQPFESIVFEFKGNENWDCHAFMKVDRKENGKYTYTLLNGSICANPHNLPRGNQGNRDYVEKAKEKFSVTPNKESFGANYLRIINEGVTCDILSESIRLVCPYRLTPWRDWKVAEGTLKGHSFRDVQDYYGMNVPGNRKHWQHQYAFKTSPEGDYVSFTNAIELCNALLELDDLSKVTVKLYGRFHPHICIEKSFSMRIPKQEAIIDWLHQAQEKLKERIKPSKATKRKL